MTIEQKQHLLAYLGYYTIEDATKQFQKDYGLPVTGVFDSDTEARIKEVIAVDEKPRENENFWDGIKYFDRDEFKCKCGKYCDGFPAEMNETLLRVADRVRKHFSKAAIVSSGVRCKQHNANVGGAIDSRHMRGKAMDFRVSGKSAEEVLAYVQQQPEIRYSYAIDKNYVHMDVV